MPTCYAYNCKHDSRKGIPPCTYFRFPQDKRLWKKWNDACRREKPPSKYDVLCSCHFENGDKSNVPTIFPHNVEKRLSNVSPQKKRRKLVAQDNPQKQEMESRPESPLPGPSHSSLPGPSHSTLPEPSHLRLLEPSHSTSSHTVLESELYFLQKEVSLLKEKKKLGEQQLWSFDMISEVDEKVVQYTGLPNKHHFLVLLELIGRYNINYYSGWNVTKIVPQDQLFCTLMKLRLNLPFFVLSGMFGVSDSTIHNIVITYIYVIHKLLFQGMMNVIPSREQNKAVSPACFAKFPNTRMVLDCTEIEIAIPGTLKAQKEVYSSYKHRHTFKVLIGISPNAVITYVSDLYPGSTSDKVITKDCGVLSHMIAGDLLLCDKGFLIADLCEPLGVKVNIPPFLSNPQFTEHEVILTKQIARARIHVERAIGRLKNFRILDFISPNLRDHACVIVQVCACLVNLQNTLLKDNETFMTEF